MKDENGRRLLHYSYRERIQGLKSERVDVVEAERRNARHFAILKTPASPVLRAATDEDLKRLGVRVIWLESFEELPGVLRRTCAATNER